MSRAVLIAWVVAAIAAVAAIVDIVVKPLHWERTLAVAVVVLVVAACYALMQGRRTASL